MLGCLAKVLVVSQPESQNKLYWQMKLRQQTPLILGTLLGIAVTTPVTASVLEGVGIGTGKVYSSFTFNFFEYIGECTGFSNYGKYSDVKIWVPTNLIGNKVPEPQKGRRVRLINRSNGGSYTDREWEKKPNQYLTLAESEAFEMGVERGHDNSKFALTIGNNDLIAVFYEGKFDGNNFKELATAQFTVSATSNKTPKTVNRQLSAPILECAGNPTITGSSITASNCPGTRQQVQYLACPSWTTGGAPKERRVIATLPGPQQQQQQQGRGYSIYFQNRCPFPIRLAMRYKRPSGTWVTDGWWNFDGNSGNYLASNTQRLQTNNSIIYYYAEITQGRHKGYNWSGNIYQDFNGRSLPMREQALSGENDRYSLFINCGNL